MGRDGGGWGECCLKMNLTEGRRARQTDRQTEIREFIKIRGDSEGVGGVNFFVTVKEQISG